MKTNGIADRCECGACGARAGEDVAIRAKAGIEEVQQYRRDGEAEGGFIARLYEQCPRCRTALEWPRNRGCSHCGWTNPYVLREFLAPDRVNAMWIHAYERVATLVGRGMALNDAALCVTMNMDAARAALHRSFPCVEATDCVREAKDVA